MNIHKLHSSDDYKGVTVTSVSSIVEAVIIVDGKPEVYPDYGKVNGVELELKPTKLSKAMLNTVKGDPVTKVRYDHVAKLLFINESYITSHLLPETTMGDLAKIVVKNWAGNIKVDDNGVTVDPVITIGEDEVHLRLLSEKESETEVIMIPSVLPKGKMWLASIFTSPEEQIMYEQFLGHPTIVNRLKSICKKEGLKFDDKSVDATTLPIHSKDTDSGELVVTNRIVKIFNQYKFCMNFLSHEQGTKEHDLGKVMMLVPKFCEYIMMTAKRSSEGKVPNAENYENELFKAINSIAKKPSLMNSYENNLV